MPKEKMDDSQKIAKLEEKVERLEKFFMKLAVSNDNIFVRVKADKYEVTIPLWQYIKEYCPDLDLSDKKRWIK